MSGNVGESVISRGDTDTPVRNPWLILLGCTIAVGMSSGAVVVYALSLFIAPLATEFHWSRTTISLGFSMMTLCLAVTAPFAGRAFDHFGIRRTLMILLPLFGLSLAAFSQLPDSVPVYLALFGIAGVLGAFQSSIAYVKVISEWFDDKRGLALGITMSGVGFGGIILSQVVRLGLERGGWRLGFVALGSVVLLVGLLSVLSLVHERRGTNAAAEARLNHDLPGLTVKEALRDSNFWLIVFFVFCMSMTVNGIAATSAAIMGWKGVSASDAAGLLSTLAIASLVGRIGTGFIVDRIFAPRVAAVICVVTIAGILALYVASDRWTIVAALVAIGLALGAETDIIGYILGRYCGLRHFGALFGVALAVFSLAPAVGIPLLGMSFDATQSYGTALLGFAASVLVGGVAILRVGPYKYEAAHG